MAISKPHHEGAGPQQSAADALPGRRMPRVLRQFLDTEASGGVVLLVAALIALAWANSPWRASYESLWATELSLRIGRFGLTDDLHHWINDGLMAIFFFVVGLEIKRELVHGDLRDPRAAAVPVVAALGGMVFPALLYVAVNAGGQGAKGWAIPMATDIAFAIGVVALLGTRVPGSLKLFLLTLAIVDDIGAIVVIAIFYPQDFDPLWLGSAAVLIATMLALRRAGVVWLPVFIALGVGVWLATHASGVHATIAGVVLGLLTPARSSTPTAVARLWASDLDDEPSPSELATMTSLAKETVSTVERLEHRLHPWSSFVVVPLFGLANAGVAISADSFGAPGASAVAFGVAAGLVVGKAVGITTATWVAVRAGLGRLPDDTSWAQVGAIATIAGIGFTVSLFITELAFGSESSLGDAAKLGVLGASAVAGGLGAMLLRGACRSAGTEADVEAHGQTTVMR